MVQDIARLTELCRKKPFCVFTDLDYTCCVADEPDYETRNYEALGVRRCFMVPSVRRAFLELHHRGCPIFFITGRHWSDRRLDDRTRKYVPDGALNDLLGGPDSPFAGFDAIAGHGRQIIRDRKVCILKRSDDPARRKAEQLFERYAGERMLNIKRMVMSLFPDAAPYVHAEYKKHISYVNIIDYPVKDKSRFDMIFDFMKKQVGHILTGKDENGVPARNVPENIGGTFVSSLDPRGSVDIRSLSQNKGRALIHSGFMEQAFETGFPVLVMGDSLGPHGTDRDMFLCLKEFFAKRRAAGRIFFLHVLNREEHRILDKSDPCFPDIVVPSPEELGKLMLFITV